MGRNWVNPTGDKSRARSGLNVAMGRKPSGASDGNGVPVGRKQGASGDSADVGHRKR